MVHPRATRNHPLRILWRRKYQFFTNNINGSPGYLQKLFLSLKSPTHLYANAISCHNSPAAKPITVDIGAKNVKFQCFVVQFWCEDELQTLATISLEVQAPFSWTPQKFLDVFEENLNSHRVISLINTYYINGER
jgi:hypothetical protein